MISYLGFMVLGWVTAVLSASVWLPLLAYIIVNFVIIHWTESLGWTSHLEADIYYSIIALGYSVLGWFAAYVCDFDSIFSAHTIRIMPIEKKSEHVGAMARKGVPFDPQQQTEETEHEHKHKESMSVMPVPPTPPTQTRHTKGPYDSGRYDPDNVDNKPLARHMRLFKGLIIMVIYAAVVIPYEYDYLVHYLGLLTLFLLFIPPVMIYYFYQPWDNFISVESRLTQDYFTHDTVYMRNSKTTSAVNMWVALVVGIPPALFGILYIVAAWFFTDFYVALYGLIICGVADMVCYHYCAFKEAGMFRKLKTKPY
jgi:hypothetical protein